MRTRRVFSFGDTQLTVVFPLVIGAIAMVALAAGTGYYLRSSTKKDVQNSHISLVQRQTMQVGGMERSYLSYVPVGLPAGAPLVIVLHGSSANAQAIRANTGYEFENLARTNNFALVYPNGFKGNWNDCRVDVTFPAHHQNIDDKSFLQALIAQYVATAHIDPSKVFIVGYSNGGEMAFRMAFETPYLIRGIAAIAANLPTPTNNGCLPSNQPVPALLMHGTKDPVSPYAGGMVSFFGLGTRGEVVSTPDTAAAFAAMNGQVDPPTVTTLPHRQESGRTSVEVTDYQQAGKAEVELYTIFGGGHVIPQDVHRPPRILGAVTLDVDGPQVIWDFFDRQLRP